MEKQKSRQRKKTIWFLTSAAALCVLFILFLWEFNENMRKAELIRNRDMMENLAQQASLVAENKLVSAQNVLKAVAKGIHLEEAFAAEEAADYLGQVAEENGMNRIGLADAGGELIDTNGITGNVSERTFFQASMRGEDFISMISRVSQEERIVLSVPLRNREKEINGVLYCVILREDFNLYARSEMEHESERFVHIIDSEGKYLVYGGGDKIWREHEESFFAVLDQEGIDTEEITENIQNKRSMFLEMKAGDSGYLLLFSPMSVKNWCAVTVLTEDALMENVDYSKRNVLTFILKILCAILAMMAVGYYILSREKKEIKMLNRELLLKDKVFQVAISETGSYVFTYDLKEKTMTLMNRSREGKENFPDTLENFPDTLENFPDNVQKFAPMESAAYNEIKRMIRELEEGKEYVEGNFSLEFSGRVIHYKSKVIRIKEGNDTESLCVGIMVDVTTEKQNEFVLREWIGKDPLTKTDNRMAASEKIEEILKREHCSTCAFLIMDIDNFKSVNDSLGHLTGDKVLVDVATIIRHHVRPKDIVCRLGGDEFVVFLVDIPESVIDKNVKTLLKKLNLTYGEGGKQESVSASIGIAAAPQDGTDFQTLYEKADQALYEVKQNGKNSYKMYRKECREVKEED